MAGLSSFFHLSSAKLQAPMMAFPAIKVILEALTLPELPVVPVSDAISLILSTGNPKAFDAINKNAV